MQRNWEELAQARELTWDEIGGMLKIGKSTAKRWHEQALAKLKIPEKPIITYLSKDFLK